MKWSRENYHHNLSSPYSLRLASADAGGKIIVWDVVSGVAHCEIQEHSKPIQGKAWLLNIQICKGSKRVVLWITGARAALKVLKWVWKEKDTDDPGTKHGR